METQKPKANIYFLLQYVRPYLPQIIITLLLLVAGRIFSSLEPLWLKKIIDGVIGGSTLGALATVIATYFGLSVSRIVFDYLRDYIFTPAEQGVSKTLSERLYEHVLQLPVAYYHEQRIGALAKKVSRGGRAASFIADILVLSVLPTFVELIIVTGLLLKLYPPIYALITFTTVVVYTMFTVWATAKRQKYRLAANQAEDEVSAHEVDAFNNIDTIKYFNNERWLNQLYRTSIDKWYSLSVSSNRLFSLVAAGQSSILLIGTGLVLFLAINQALSGSLTVGDLVLLTTYLVRLTAPVDVLGFVYRQLKDNLTDLEGLATILKEEITIKEPDQPIEVPSAQGAVEFDQVTFAYADGRKVLDQLSVSIKPGQRVAFVGPSGVGKSTIVKLLFRLFEPASGEILVDSVPINQLSKESRKQIFSLVPQEPILFNTSIIENIRFGKPDASLEEVIEAAKLANIHDFIDRLPDKYQTVVGERGVKLSGGEKQRVAIARSVIGNPRVLVFDEATSALDTHNERIIQESLNRVSVGRTTIAIAHRLSTIVDSDTIFVLNQGKVEESGTHEALLNQHGLYARLWALQAQKPQSAASPSQN